MLHPWNQRAARLVRVRAGPEFVVLRVGNGRLILHNAPFIIGHEEFGNPWGKRGSLLVQTYVKFK